MGGKSPLRKSITMTSVPSNTECAVTSSLECY